MSWLSFHAHWHLSHHTLDIFLPEYKMCMPYPLFPRSGCRSSHLWAMWVLKRSQIWSPNGLFDPGCHHKEPAQQPHPQHAAWIVQVQVWSPMGWVSSYRSAAFSSAGLAELTGADRQKKAAAWAGLQLVLATLKHMLWTAFSAEAWLQRSGTSAFYNCWYLERRTLWYKMNKCNNGLILVMYSQPWRRVGLCIALGVGYIEWMLPVRLDCLFERLTKVLNEENAADAE